MATTATDVLFKTIETRTGVKVTSKNDALKYQQAKLSSRRKSASSNHDTGPVSLEEQTSEAMGIALHLWDFQKRRALLPPLKNTHPFEWSEEALSLNTALPLDMRSERNILQYFRTLHLNCKGIQVIDAKMAKMKHLKELHLCQNEIKDMGNFPPSVEVVNLSMNVIEQLTCEDRIHRLSVLALMLPYNRISFLEHIEMLFPNLIILDVSFNSVTNLDQFEASVTKLPKLAGLLAKGNPISLLKDYRLRLVLALKGLRQLDGLKIEEWERNAELSDRSLALESNVIHNWQLAVEQRKTHEFKSEKRNNIEAADFRALTAALRLQHKYRMHTLRETTNLQRDILKAYRSGELITLKIQIDKLKIIEHQPVMAPSSVAAAPGPSSIPDKGKGKGSKDKDKVNKQQQQQEQQALVNQPLKPKESFTVRILLPFLSHSRLCIFTLPYIDRSPELTFNFGQDFQFPISITARDLFYQKGLEFQVWQRVEQHPSSEAPPASVVSSPDGSGSRSLSPRQDADLQQTQVAAGCVSLRPFFNSELFRACNGSPKISQDVKVQLKLPSLFPNPVGSEGLVNKAATTVVSSTTKTTTVDAVLCVRLQLNTAFDPSKPSASDWVRRSLVSDQIIHDLSAIATQQKV